MLAPVLTGRKKRFQPKRGEVDRGRECAGQKEGRGSILTVSRSQARKRLPVASRLDAALSPYSRRFEHRPQTRSRQIDK